MSDHPSPWAPHRSGGHPDHTGGRADHTGGHPDRTGGWVRATREPDLTSFSALPLFQEQQFRSEQTLISTPGRPTATASVDWTEVRDLKRTYSSKMTDALREYEETHGREADHDDRRMMGQPILDEILDQHQRERTSRGTVLTSDEFTRLRKALRDAVWGMGRLQPLLEIADAEDIVIVGSNPVDVYRTDGAIDTLPPVADTDDELIEQIIQIAQNSTPRRAFDATNYDVTLMIGEQFRMHAVNTEVSHRPSVVIRQHLLRTISLADLAHRGLFPMDVARFLDTAIIAGKKIVIAGEVGAGKTTLCRACIDAIPLNQRIATIETDLELFTHLQRGRHNTLVLHERSGHGDSTTGHVPVSRLMPIPLRQIAPRLVVGEVRTPAEAAAMLEAMQVSGGSLATIHGETAQQAVSRLVDRVAAGSAAYSALDAGRAVGSMIDLIIHVAMIDNSWQGGTRERLVTQILHLDRGKDSDDGVSRSVVYDSEQQSLKIPAEWAHEFNLKARRGDLPRHEAGGGERS